MENNDMYVEKIIIPEGTTQEDIAKTGDLKLHEKVSEVYENIVPTEIPKDPREIIFNKICEIQMQNAATVLRKGRKREHVFVRQCYFWVSKVLIIDKKLGITHSLAYIGEYVEKDHATVLHGIKTINNLRDTDKSITFRTDRIIKDCKTALEQEIKQYECKHPTLKKTKGTFIECTVCGNKWFEAGEEEPVIHNCEETSGNGVVD